MKANDLMTQNARVQIELDRTHDIPDRLFGSFVEHLGRTVYTGIYEPTHTTADISGFRADVASMTKDLGVSTIRYPGGNFVSGYRWEDGVGPQDRRPSRLDLAWRRVEPNEVGTDEFLGWCERYELEPMLAVNLGTRGIEAAADLVEYVNLEGGTQLSEWRKANGREEPWGVKIWCLGNEMDGTWQLGHKTAHEYGRLAAEAGRAMRRVDPSIELVACGSSAWTMPTFGDWERTVLEETWDVIDYLSLHAYYEERNGDRKGFLASGELMHRFIGEVLDIADDVATRKGSDKRIKLSFDEWNVWYLQRFDGEESLPLDGIAPLFEDHHSSLDAVVVGDLLISLLRNSDRVRAASLAQLVNSLAPMITAPGGGAWKQTTYFPFQAVAQASRGGHALATTVTSDPLDTDEHGQVPGVNAAAVRTADGRNLLFATNRSDSPVKLDIMVEGGLVEITAQHTLEAGHDDIHSGPDDATHGIPRHLSDGLGTLPPESWSVIEWTSH